MLQLFTAATDNAETSDRARAALIMDRHADAIIVLNAEAAALLDGVRLDRRLRGVRLLYEPLERRVGLAPVYEPATHPTLDANAGGLRRLMPTARFAADTRGPWAQSGGADRWPVYIAAGDFQRYYATPTHQHLTDAGPIWGAQNVAVDPTPTGASYRTDVLPDVLLFDLPRPS